MAAGICAFTKYQSESVEAKGSEKEEIGKASWYTDVNVKTKEALYSSLDKLVPQFFILVNKYFETPGIIEKHHGFKKILPVAMQYRRVSIDGSPLYNQLCVELEHNQFVAFGKASQVAGLFFNTCLHEAQSSGFISNTVAEALQSSQKLLIAMTRLFENWKGSIASQKKALCYSRISFVVKKADSRLHDMDIKGLQGKIKTYCDCLLTNMTFCKNTMNTNGCSVPYNLQYYFRSFSSWKSEIEKTIASQPIRHLQAQKDIYQQCKMVWHYAGKFLQKYKQLPICEALYIKASSEYVSNIGVQINKFEENIAALSEHKSSVFVFKNIESVESRI